MNKRITASYCCLYLALSACSSDKSEQKAYVDPKPNTPTKVLEATPPVIFSEDPDMKKAQQQKIMDHMMDDLQISTDNVIGEAMRRGIDIDPEDIEKRRVKEAKFLSKK